MIDNAPADEPLVSTLADDPLLGQIVPLFAEEIPNRISQFSQRLAESDWDGLRCLAHQMKGAAGSYGFETITLAAGRLEQAIKYGLPEPPIRQLANDLIGLCRRVRVVSTT